VWESFSCGAGLRIEPPASKNLFRGLYPQLVSGLGCAVQKGDVPPFCLRDVAVLTIVRMGAQTADLVT
jgi:hypothetical protein